MKTMFQFLFVALMGLSTHAFADGDHSGHGGVSAAKAAELALHRVGKLVDLKKIDASFVSHFHAVQLTTLPMGHESGAAYQAFIYQAPNAGQHAKVELLLDMAGKALSHKVVGTASAGSTQWPGKDPLTIAENAFHWVLDNGSNATVKPFFSNLSEMNLTATGSHAIATFKSTQTAQVLVVHLTLDGAVTKTEIQ